jgi:hypothetical protein
MALSTIRVIFIDLRQIACLYSLDSYEHQEYKRHGEQQTKHSVIEIFFHLTFHIPLHSGMGSMTPANDSETGNQPKRPIF